MDIIIDADLRGVFGPIRDQDPRPTCMAFAASDTHAAVRPEWNPLSVEWAYYHALQREGGQPADGVGLSAMLTTLHEDGQPLEASWPYIVAQSIDTTQYSPPYIAGPLHRRASALIPATTESIVEQIDVGNPVLFTARISRDFFKVAGDGIVSTHEPTLTVGNHALIAVGHGHRDHERFILIRNSWGPDWALEGYAWLAFPYLRQRLLGAAILKGEL